MNVHELDIVCHFNSQSYALKLTLIHCLVKNGYWWIKITGKILIPHFRTYLTYEPKCPIYWVQWNCTLPYSAIFLDLTAKGH